MSNHWVLCGGGGTLIVKALVTWSLVGAVRAEPILVPAVQQADWRGVGAVLPDDVCLAGPEEWRAELRSCLWILDEVLEQAGRSPARVVADGAAWIHVQQVAPMERGNEAYRLRSGPEGIEIEAADRAGVFNALATLAQLIEQASGDPRMLPGGTIDDGPALPMRAVHIDLTCQQYTAAYVQELMRKLARYKVNTILMEYSDMFPFRAHFAIRHPEAWTPEELAGVLATAEACHQQIIPFLQCLGHLEYVLHRDAYRPLGAAHNGYMYCPSTEASWPLVKGLIDEMHAAHPGIRYLHIGGDEVSAMHCPRCKEHAAQHGFASLYARHYARVAAYCASRGVKPMMWADMVGHHPEALADLPRNITWVVWDYGSTGEVVSKIWHGAQVGQLDALSPAYVEVFGKGVGLGQVEQRGGLVPFGHAAGLDALGFQAVTGSAARSGGDNFGLPRTRLHMANTRRAFLQARAFGLEGGIVTSWSYRAAPHEVCLPTYAAAGYGWNPTMPDVPALLAAFLEQRYGIGVADGLARAILDESEVIPLTTVAQPSLDDGRRAWMTTAATQWQAIADVVEADTTAFLKRNAHWRAMMSKHDEVWAAALPSATRHVDELHYWALAREHLAHRLDLVPVLIAWARHRDKAASADAFPSAVELLRLHRRSEALRRRWASRFAGIYTPGFLEVDLEQRFDVETQWLDEIATVAERRSP